MMAVCEPLAPAAGFVSGILSYVDCQAQTIGGQGYQALAAPGSSLSLILTGFLTLFVAFYGYRLLLGHTPVLREGVLALVKIGVVLALATSWIAYRTLVYDVALRGPAELASEIGAPAALPGAGGGLSAHLDFTDLALNRLVTLGPGPAAPYLTPGPDTGVTSPLIPGTGEATSSGFDGLALGGARLLFLAGAIGSLAAVRLIAGLLLALGPFFIAFLLFDGTRGLFEGWLRVLAGAALGAVGSAILLGVELALLEPWLIQLLAIRAADQPITGVPVELFAVTLVFALALLAVLIAAGRVAFGFRLPPAWRSAPVQLAQALRGETPAAAAARAIPAAAGGRSRAVAVADAVAATQRRESGPLRAAGTAADGAPSRAGMHIGRRDVPEPPPPVPLGQSYRPRQTRNRVSGSANRRDRGR